MSSGWVFLTVWLLFNLSLFVLAAVALLWDQHLADVSDKQWAYRESQFAREEVL